VFEFGEQSVNLTLEFAEAEPESVSISSQAHNE
jgi:hypothetical protein